MSDKERLKAAAAGQTSWAQYANAREHQRYMKPAPSTSRRRCSCGCGQRATHTGMANGLAMTMGCEFSMARWVRDG